MEFLPVEPGYRSYLTDQSGLPGHGEGIAFPETLDEVRQALRSEPQGLTIQGARTGLMGGAVPEGGRILNLSRLTALGHPEKTETGWEITAQAGVTLEDLQKAAGAKGLFYPPDPTETTATLGGMFATAAAGPGQLGYGSPCRYVLGLQWVPLNGDLWQIRRGQYVCRKGRLLLPDGRETSAPEGMDLIDWLWGREGRSGVAGAFRLRLLEKPREQWGLVFFFPEEEQALSFGERLRGLCRELTAAEYYNRGALDLLRSHGRDPLLKGLPALPEDAQGAVSCELASMEDCTPALMALLDVFDGLGGREEDSWAESGDGGVRKFRAMRHGVPSILSEGDSLPGDFQGPEAMGASFARNFAAMAPGAVIYGHLLTNGLRVHVPVDQGTVLEALGRYVLEHGGSLCGEYGYGKRKALLFPSEKIQIREKL